MAYLLNFGINTDKFSLSKDRVFLKKFQIFNLQINFCHIDFLIKTSYEQFILHFFQRLANNNAIRITLKKRIFYRNNN